MEQEGMMEKTESKTGGIAKFQEMSKDWENNPKILRKIIENLSEKIDELQAKATNSISENDIQIVFDGNAWCAYRLPFRNLQEDDAGFGATPQIALTALLKLELPDGWEENHDNN
jgi:hypothetical protein